MMDSRAILRVDVGFTDYRGSMSFWPTSSIDCVAHIIQRCLFCLGFCECICGFFGGMKLVYM